MFSPKENEPTKEIKKDEKLELLEAKLCMEEASSRAWSFIHAGMTLAVVAVVSST
jgi:hypothetical protein